MIFNSNFSPALSGLQTAAAKTAQSAEKVVADTAQTFNSFEKSLSENPAAEASAPSAVQSALYTPVSVVPDIVADMTTMQTATHAYKANIAAVESWNAMMKAAADITKTPTDHSV